MKRKDKEIVVQELSAALNESPAVFLTDFKGLKVTEISDLRRKVAEAGGRYKVVKNTLFGLAAKDSPVEELNDLLVGNNGMSFASGDPAPLAKALVDFAKDNEKLVVKGGMLGEQRLSPEQIKALADLPGRDVLLGMLLGAMNAVPGGFVRTLAALPQNLMNAMVAVRDQKEAEAA